MSSRRLDICVFPGGRPPYWVLKFWFCHAVLPYLTLDLSPSTRLLRIVQHNSAAVVDHQPLCPRSPTSINPMLSRSSVTVDLQFFLGLPRFLLLSDACQLKACFAFQSFPIRWRCPSQCSRLFLRMTTSLTIPASASPHRLYPFSP